MKIGQIAARGVALRRYLARARPALEVIEVYPRASMDALGIKRGPKGELPADAIERLGLSLRHLITGKHPRDAANLHELDAVVAAYTGWLYAHRPNAMRQPTSDHIAADGWIWVPA